VSVATGEHSVLKRVSASGVRAASIVDLVTIGFSRREDDVEGGESVSRRMLQRFLSIRGLVSAAPSDLGTTAGLDSYEVLRAQALMEIGRRSQNAGKGPLTTIDSPDDAMEVLDWLRDEKREFFVAILLDSKNQIMRTANIHIGTLTMSVVGAREVFREAIRDGASSLIVAHNHPSGDPTPSPEDIEITRRLVAIGDMLDIPVRDHVIIGERRAVSLRQQGYVR
jgi:DNA repair protein RadC